MKIYHAMDEESPLVSKEDKKKIAVLKLVDVGKYIKGVGIRDGQFYVIAENETDEIYLEYKVVINDINEKISHKMDYRTYQSKDNEFHNKRLNAMKKLMEMPR
jgi:hypothetical protein